MSEADLGPCCTDLACSWQPIPHVHEGREVYPAPPARPEWIAALATDENVPTDGLRASGGTEGG